MSSFEEVKKIISTQLDVGEDEIELESLIVDDLGADSLDVVELIMAIEDKIDIEILDSDAEKIQTVQDIVTYIDSNKS